MYKYICFKKYGSCWQNIVSYDCLQNLTVQSPSLYHTQSRAALRVHRSLAEELECQALVVFVLVCTKNICTSYTHDIRKNMIYLITFDYSIIQSCLPEVLFLNMETTSLGLLPSEVTRLEEVQRVPCPRIAAQQSILHIDRYGCVLCAYDNNMYIYIYMSLSLSPSTIQECAI